ncbi:MAG: S8 family peptidase [Anaerolineales bacterium]
MDSPRRKVTSQLLQSMSTVRGSEELPIIVQYVPHRRVLRHAEPREGLRESYAYRLAPLAHAHATRDAILALEQDEEVLRIYQDSPVHALMDRAPTQIGVPYAWAAGLTGAGVAIALVDTGIDPTHPDLKERIVDLADFTGQGEVDGNGHGSHCAGIAAGTGAASDGLYRGIAPGAALFAARALDAYGNGMMSDVMAGIDWAVSAGVQIVSLSLGGAAVTSGEDPLVELCNAAVDAGVVICAAAGNTGPAPSTIGSPGVAEKVITVGAIARDNTIASFSSRGPTADGRVKPDIVLPGTAIIAPRAAGTALGTVQGEYYTALSGTSMACPMAAGLCALALEAKPSLRPSELKDALRRSAVDLGLDTNTQGTGRADTQQLFSLLGVDLPAEPAAPPSTTPSEPAQGDEPAGEQPTGEEPPKPQGCLFGWLSAFHRRAPR